MATVICTGKMVSKRAARVHGPETCAPILDSRYTPSRKSLQRLQRLHWRSCSNGDMGMGTIRRGSRSKLVASHGSLSPRPV